ncbi:unnamed protein product [Kuraishia capsulata CBS 1993]|uniref:Zn(2)-C6 fungal-type domain-containing protein n=1 Tax=Kuraishia capsulata CBS 1993 TaxID=1382522 RepID=W6MPN0_9ASCO|nr:uncharacterized protein KUCA_T00004275001 [Kuraishia capsulata CBS 1993]CDK28293.1 unnamed protein product [Kuraishia capsulata CBS 1993]
MMVASTELSPKPKTIKASGAERVAQACDRCRSKKTRCDGRRPQCGQCAIVGIECKLSDKLSRKAFPRGYTESLEERVRELEFENKKLQKLVELKGSEPSLVKPVTNENLNMLNKEQLVLPPDHIHDATCNCENHPNSVHERPVSIAGSVDLNLTDDTDSLLSATDFARISNDENRSFEQINAPGAAAAIAIQNKLNSKDFINLANLIAMSIPRSTEETMFIPNVLAKICNVHGFNSKAAFMTARSIALLKETSTSSAFKHINFRGVDFTSLTKDESIEFFQSLNLPNHTNLDLFITSYFSSWNDYIPSLNKQLFMANYVKFNKSRDVDFTDGLMFGNESFVEILIIILTLVMKNQEKNLFSHQIDSEKEITKQETHYEILMYYDHLIHQFIRSNLSSICSVQSLQNTTLELFYCLNIGDLTTSYDLRGKMITMAQQLRLHRCPSAVLGSSGSTLSKIQQGERRILFWNIFTLDSFSSMLLGVPRLLKDSEIECALPSSNNDNNTTDDINMVMFNNTALSLVGKVSDSALSIMRYSRVLGTVLDSIFKRNSGSSISDEICFVLENQLESWRKDLPGYIAGDVDVNTVLKEAEYTNLNEKQLSFLFLYFQAKLLIYLPIMGSESSTSASRNSSSYIIIQQITSSLLSVYQKLSTKEHNFHALSLPLSSSKQVARFALIFAKGSLEYGRGGSLFQESKMLLGDIIKMLKFETEIGLLGCISKNCVESLEVAIDQILSPPPSLKKIKRKTPPLRTSELRLKDEHESTLNDIFTKRAKFGGEPTIQSKQRNEPYDLNNLFQPYLPENLEFGVDASLGLNLLNFDFDFNLGGFNGNPNSGLESGVKKEGSETFWNV